MARTVTFFYDVISPWSMFAYIILKRYQKPWHFNLNLRPIYLGGVMVASGNQPPATVANKGTYMNTHDLPLTAGYFGVPYKFPEVFPVNTINIIRFLRIVESKAPEKIDALTAIFFDQMWGPNANAVAAGKSSTFPSIIPTSLIPAATVKEWIELSQSNENKEGVKKDSAEVANDKGAFGFPYMIVEREDGKTHAFFGSDRFELMAYFLGEKWNGPYPDGKRPSHL